MIESKTESVAQRVEQEIRKSIVTLEFLPGTPLSEKELADRYGVSRQPVREALIALARAELVEIRPRRGTRVVRISADRMRQARFVRESIEIAVVREACRNFDPEVRRRIDEILAAQEVHAAAHAHYLFQREDQAFHAALAEGAGFPNAWEALVDIKAHIDRVCHLTLPLPQTLPLLVEQHRAVMAAIDAGDVVAAETAMRAHLSEILQALPEVEKTFGYLFTNPAYDL
ncbi:MAG: GntR family transcriptional regulator [Siculibacillus sp.]|nr:GntR family transcriptional regulator [Siculibacillus sp.]